MKLDQLGNPIYQDNDLVTAIYNRSLDIFDQLLVEQSNDVEQFYRQIDITPKKVCTADLTSFDQEVQSVWMIPDEYKQLDIEEYLVQVCPEENYPRLLAELTKYKEKNLYPLLQALKYIVDTLRKHNIMWGVGRGSSVSSYVLYLLGVHKIDCVKYELDFKEFLR
jgi:DNA polymerase III alpha subunit